MWSSLPRRKKNSVVCIKLAGLARTKLSLCQHQRSPISRDRVGAHIHTAKWTNNAAAHMRVSEKSSEFTVSQVKHQLIFVFVFFNCSAPLSPSPTTFCFSFSSIRRTAAAVLLIPTELQVKVLESFHCEYCALVRADVCALEIKVV